MYSIACDTRNTAPSATVMPSQISSWRRLLAFSAWWAMVRVTPEVSRIRVLSSGRPQAGISSNAPPTAAGPADGQPVLKLSHRKVLVATPFTPSPPSHGTDSARA